MSIKWNEDIRMSDVRKFLNKEVNLKPLSDLMSTKVDFNKCAQTVAIIAVFGVIPAFTYGTVLGTLDGQRVVLMGEVSSLQAQLVSSVSKATTTPVSAVQTDKSVYAPGTPIGVTFYNNIPASTTNIYQISLHTATGTLVQNLTTMSPYQGPNKYSFSVDTSTVERNAGPFVVRVTAIRTGQFANSNKFEVMKTVVAPKVSVISVSQRLQENISDDLSDDQGMYDIEYEVTANNQAIFIKPGTATRSTLEMNQGANYLIRDSYNATTTGTTTANVTRVSGGVWEAGFLRIDPYASARLKLTVYFDPTVTGVYRAQLYSVNYSNVATDAMFQTVLVPVEKFQTGSGLVQDALKSTLPAVSLISARAVAVDNTESLSDNEGRFTIVFSVTSRENTYMSRNVISGTTTLPQPVLKRFTRTVIVDKVNAEDNYYSFYLKAGETRVFTLDILAMPYKTEAFGISLESLKFGPKQFILDSVLTLNPNIFRTPSLVIKNVEDTTPLVSMSNPYRNIYIERKADVVFGFQLNNPAKQDVYISRDGLKAFAYETSLKIASSTVTPSGAWVIQGDTKDALVIKAGSARQFYNSATVFNRGNQVSQSVKIKKIYFSDSLSSLQKYGVTAGLDALQISATF